MPLPTRSAARTHRYAAIVARMEPVARRVYRLVEPTHLVTYFAEEPTEEFVWLGLRNYWNGYFAGARPLRGRDILGY